MTSQNASIQITVNLNNFNKLTPETQVSVAETLTYLANGFLRARQLYTYLAEISDPPPGVNVNFLIKCVNAFEDGCLTMVEDIREIVNEG